MKKEINDLTAIKQDINMLENPIWFQHTKFAGREEGHVWRDIEGYVYRAGYKLPTKPDIIFLLFILSQCQRENWNCKLELSQYEILVGSGTGQGKLQYLRLRDSFKRWKNVSIEYSGSFYNGKSYETLGFGIIDFWGVNEKTKKVEIRLNEDWILKIKNSLYYKFIDFDRLKKLRNPLGMRLYEILLKSFQGRSVWRIGATKLARKIPIHKKYPSQIVERVQLAVNIIQKKTNLNVHLELDKKKRGSIILIFRLKRNKQQDKQGKLLPPPKILKNDNLQVGATGIKTINLIPSKYAESVKELVSTTYKEKGPEYVRKAIEYTNLMDPINYPAYLTSTLKNGYGESFNSEAKKYIDAKKEGRECFQRNKGSCGAVWDTHEDDKASGCHWCAKFERSRLFAMQGKGN